MTKGGWLAATDAKEGVTASPVLLDGTQDNLKRIFRRLVLYVVEIVTVKLVCGEMVL
jgi:hypothetical protein